LRLADINTKVIPLFAKMISLVGLVIFCIYENISLCQILEQNGGQTKGSRVVLLTDGEETLDPKVAIVKPQLLAAGINVDTVLLSNKADPVLISLAASTGR